MGRLYNAVLISNISMEPFLIPVLQENMQTQKRNAAVIAIPYQEYRESQYLVEIQEADLVAIWLNLESLLPDMHNAVTDKKWREQKAEEVHIICQNLAEYITLNGKAKIIWFLFEDYFLHLSVVTGHRSNLFVDKINQRLQEGLSDQISFIDLKYLIAEMGIGTAFSAKNKFRWNFPYSKSLAITVAGEIQKQYFIENGISKKCLVLDCDNVL